MGPSAVPCRLLGYYKLTTLCGSSLIMRVVRTVLCSIDTGSVSVFTVQIDDTSHETEVSATASVWLILCFSCLYAV